MKYNRAIIFSDYGVDDAAALLHVLAHAELFDAIDVVPIGGNVDVDTAYRNAHTVLAATAFGIDKVRIVDTRAVKQPSADIPEIHGSDGIGDFLTLEKCVAPVVGFDEYKRELERTATPERDCVLSLGPCTVPLMLGYTPFCTVLMGGATSDEPNYGDYEFNEALDPDAFKKYAFTATAVATLDTCHDKRFAFETLETGDALTDKFISRCVELCRARNVEKISVYDYVAALAVTTPERFEAVRVRRADGVEYNELRLIK